ncbi:MAG: hypothetical protein ACFFCW_35960, partial [Candidatus Hodarchaeota archaeon]
PASRLRGAHPHLLCSLVAHFLPQINSFLFSARERLHLLYIVPSSFILSIRNSFDPRGLGIDGLRGYRD